MALPINLEEAVHYLTNNSAEERIQWAREQTPKLMLSTSGGKKFSLLPHLTAEALGTKNFPILFVDTRYYPQGTLDAVTWLEDQGYDIRRYSSPHTPTEDERDFGSEFTSEESPHFKKWVERRKHEPTQRAINELQPDLWIGGRFLGQTEERKTLQVIERRGDLYQLSPIFDWNQKDIESYIKKHNLPSNPVHKDYTKSNDGKGECQMWFFTI